MFKGRDRLAALMTPLEANGTTQPNQPAREPQRNSSAAR